MSGTESEVMRVLAFVLIAGNLLALVAGLALLIAPHKVITWLGLRSAHPVSVRRVTKSLEIPHNSEQVMLAYPRVLGLALLVGGVYVLIKGSLFLSSVSLAHGASMLANLFPAAPFGAATWESIWIAALVLILFGALLAILVGLLALIRVQTLQSLSSVTNRWVSTRQAVKPVSRPYYGIDHFVGTHPQVWGGIITLLAIYTLLMIVWFGRGVVA